MEIVSLILIFLVAIPAALVVWCAAAEASLMKNRPDLSWLLPAGAALASAMSGRRLDGSSGLTALLWTLPALYGRCTMAETAAGAALGAVMRWFGPEPPRDEPGNMGCSSGRR